VRLTTVGGCPGVGFGQVERMQRTFTGELYTRPPFPNFPYPGPSKGT